ncbi:hypothetical protein [Oceanobacillus chungangensis]|uniref:Uncharacterized protein n=1 Tax=Oceanobacillus chungangensis TaxID=1229152 RepID=A0A3D8PG67_9BACI|nr:hypothetical protein [Oceanobacillus chungangensis]RDW15073.1 hypothetical protein CWR45_18830 [Oceanobacillus chungangensis]
MTAEVVVMNKRGLSMAADSAITSGGEGVQKVYNTANKLFSLSSDHPVGIMVYGAASFMEVPWDVIIKSYRDHLGKKKFADLTDYVEDLLNFLRHDNRFKNEEVEEIIVYRIFSDKLKRIVREVEETITNEKNTGSNVSPKKVTDWLVDCVSRNIKSYKNEEKSFLELNYQVFKEKFGTVIDEVKDELIMYEIPENLAEKFYMLAFEATKKDYFSIGSTGLVIAGYGEKEIFPHLLNYRLEGFVCNQLKYKKLKEKKISYTSDKEDGTASVTAFAQREMVDSFISGMEPSMEEVIFDIIAKVLKDYPNQIQKHLSIQFTDEQVTDLEKMGKEVYESIEDTLKEYQQTNYIEPLLGVVRSLPKEELADMAETLVNLTSFKRRVTRATETVGPPIDVAIITKGDGFVWMKRKNYMNSEINARL